MKRILFAALILMIVSAGVSFSVSGIPVLILSPNGKFGFKSSLNSAVSSGDTANKTIYVMGYSPLTDNLTVPTTRAIKVVFAGYIDTGGSYTLAINGPFEAPLARCFTGTNAPIFGPGSVDKIPAEWMGADATGVSDSTTSIQKAINSGIVNHIPITLPGVYSVTNTLTVYDGTDLGGDLKSQYPNGFAILPKTSVINFTPSVTKDLFVYAPYTGNSSGFIFHTSIHGLYIHGNSVAGGATTSRYALPLSGVIYSKFYDLAINGFQVPIVCTGTINNRFENIYTTGTVSAISYGGTATTDVWNQCSFWGSPVGIQTTGSTIGVRFEHCLFEQLDNYGADIVKDTQNMIFDSCYSEDVPFANNSAGAMFRVGNSGTLAGELQLTVNGGKYSGRNAGLVGSWLTVDYIDGAMISNVNVSRYTNVINTTANTPNYRILINGLAGISYTNFISGSNHNAYVGIYPTSALGGSSSWGGFFGPIDAKNTITAPALTLTSLPEFTNNTTAVAGGLTTGNIYRNGNTVQVVRHN